QLVEHARVSLDDARKLRPELAEVRRHRRLGRADLERKRDESLLSPVVEVALDPPPSRVGGGNDPRARSVELGAALRVCDGARQGPSNRPPSAATRSRTSAWDTPRAIRVATRRNAACSSAIFVSASRLSAFAIAVATSSVNSARRRSVSWGSGRSVVETTANT